MASHHVTINVEGLNQVSSQVSHETQQISPEISLDIERILNPNDTSSPVPEKSPVFLKYFVQRCLKFVLLDRSLKKTIKVLVLLEILVLNMKTEDKSAVIYLRYLQNEILVTKFPYYAYLSRRKRRTIDETKRTTIVSETTTMQTHTEEHQENILETLSGYNHEIEEVEEKKEDERNDQEVEKAEEEKAEEEKDKPVKKKSEWWVNTRNIMAMVAILFITLSSAASFTPPVGVLDGNIFGIIFIIAMNICFMVSVAVLVFLFGITASSEHIEKRTLQISNAGLWISLFTLMVAYIANIWLIKIHVALRIWLTLFTSVWFLALSSFFFSKRIRSMTQGRKLLQETEPDAEPFILTEIFSGN